MEELMMGSYLPMDQSVSNNDRTVCQAILLVVNKSSGSGRSKSELKTIANSFKSRFETIPIRKFVIAQSHQEVTQITQGFLRRTPGPWLVISGGGSGTQRAMIQGIMTAVQKGHAALNKITHSALRLGSGNIIARHSGISPHPALALHQIDIHLAARSFIYSPIYKCQIRYSNRVVSEFGLTMAGVGHFGEVPDAVSAWRMNNQTLMNGLLHIFPLEKINTWLFFWFTLQRAFSSWASPYGFRASFPIPPPHS